MFLRQLIIASLPVAIQAVTVTRVCQSASQNFPPPYQPCQGAADYIAKTYSSNSTVFQQDAVSGCTTLFRALDCAVDLCAFPGQYLDGKVVSSAVNDILQNCQTKDGVQVYTGGYNIIEGTNATIGIYRPALGAQYAYKCSTTDSGSPLTTDCAKLVDAIPRDGNITQTDPSGCKTIASWGTCRARFCDVQGAQMRGNEAFWALSDSIFACKNNQTVSGFVQIGAKRRLGLYLDPSLAKPSNSATLFKCQDFGKSSPNVRDCSMLYQDIQNRYGNAISNSVTQTQADDGCTVLAARGGCQAELCGSTGASVGMQRVLSTFGGLNTTCSRGTQSPGDQAVVTGGYATMYGTNLTLSLLSSKTQPVNRWCNTSPNNSPKLNDCVKVLDMIDPNKLYEQAYPFSGCSLMAVNGTCRLNYCAPAGNKISGQDLKDAAVDLTFSCLKDAYTSGVRQISVNSTVSIYDPPAPGSSYGDVLCTNGNDLNLSPTKSDCDAAVNYLLGGNQAVCQNTAANPNGCTTVYTSGGCGLAMCGPVNYNIDCTQFATAALQVVDRCQASGNGNRYTTGHLGLRLLGGNNIDVVVYNHNEQPNGPGTNKRRSLEAPVHRAASHAKRNGPYQPLPAKTIRRIGDSNLFLVVTVISGPTVSVANSLVTDIFQQMYNTVNGAAESIFGSAVNAVYTATGIQVSVSSIRDTGVVAYLSQSVINDLKAAFQAVLMEGGYRDGETANYVIGYICDSGGVTNAVTAQNYFPYAKMMFQYVQSFAY